MESLRYDERSLAELLPSVLCALGVPTANPLLLEPVRQGCVMLVDGLGARQLDAASASAPFLSSLRHRHAPLSVGFPSTTATSMGSLGTGLAPGIHGLLGYEVLVPGSDLVLNELSWHDSVDPVWWQPNPTRFEQALAEGVDVTRIGPRSFDGSGLTLAALRGGRFVAAESVGERVAAAARALAGAPPGGRSLVYVYYGDLDATGHRCGVDSDAWRLQLEHVDRAAAQLAERLPAGAALWITGDHGMVDVPRPAQVNLASEPDLLEGVRLVAGEPRARYLHTRPGAAQDVLSAWRQRLGDDFRVHLREEVVAAGWFGPEVRRRNLARIGDVVVAARAAASIVGLPGERPATRQLIGAHGSLTDAELLVPLLEVRG